MERSCKRQGARGDEIAVLLPVTFMRLRRFLVDCRLFPLLKWLRPHSSAPSYMFERLVDSFELRISNGAAKLCKRSFMVLLMMCKIDLAPFFTIRSLFRFNESCTPFSFLRTWNTDSYSFSVRFGPENSKNENETPNSFSFSSDD